MEVLTVVGIGLIAVLLIVAMFVPDWTRNLLLAKLGQVGANLPVTPQARLITGLVVAVPAGVLLYGLFAVRALFADFARGHVFTERTVRHLQIFAVTVLAQAPLGPLTSAALSVLVSMADESGQRLGAIAFSVNDYFALIVGGVLFAVATVMREAARIADENAGFI
jgi:hypothetical protein